MHICKIKLIEKILICNCDGHLFINLGPRIGSSPVHSIVQVLARKENTDDFYTLKVSFQSSLHPLKFFSRDYFACFSSSPCDLFTNSIAVE